MTTSKTTAPRKTEAEKVETLRLRKTRERLTRASARLTEWGAHLEQIHADPTGYYRNVLHPPLLQSEFRPMERSLTNIAAAAAGGCALCAAWLEETAAVRERITQLRNTRPPKKAPDYSGPWLPPTGFRIPRGPRKIPAGRLPMKEPAIAAAEHMAACEARTAARKEERAAELAANKARHRALLDEFLTENPELRPDA